LALNIEEATDLELPLMRRIHEAIVSATGRRNGCLCWMHGPYRRGKLSPQRNGQMPRHA